jgi:peptide chain release factor 3
LMDEGVAQLFTLNLNGRKVIGTVGILQFEVIQYRLEHEYGAKCTFENLNVYKACWISVTDEENNNYKDFLKVKKKFLANDKKGQLIYLADSAFSLQMSQQKYPEINFHFTSEF